MHLYLLFHASCTLHFSILSAFRERLLALERIPNTNSTFLIIWSGREEIIYQNQMLLGATGFWDPIYISKVYNL